MSAIFNVIRVEYYFLNKYLVNYLFCKKGFRYICRSITKLFSLRIKSKIWIETEEGIIISDGRIRLLKLIEATGSLNKAAKEMNISYQKAWKLVDASNKASKEPLVETQIGGNKGGGTVLTPYGKSLIESFEAINTSCWEFLDAELKKYALE